MLLLESRSFQKFPEVPEVQASPSAIPHHCGPPPFLSSRGRKDTAQSGMKLSPGMLSLWGMSFITLEKTKDSPGPEWCGIVLKVAATLDTMPLWVTSFASSKEMKDVAQNCTWSDSKLQPLWPRFSAVLDHPLLSSVLEGQERGGPEWQRIGSCMSQHAAL